MNGQVAMLALLESVNRTSLSTIRRLFAQADNYLMRLEK